MEILFPYIILIVFIAPISLLCHELAHAFIAKLFGADKTTIVFGAGKQRLACSFAKVDWNIHTTILYPLYTLSERKQSFSKKERVMITLAGPLINGFMMICFLIIYYFVYRHTIILMLIAFNGWLFITNCIPFKIGQKQSDGYTIYEMMKK